MGKGVCPAGGISLTREVWALPLLPTSLSGPTRAACASQFGRKPLHFVAGRYYPMLVDGESQVPSQDTEAGWNSWCHEKGRLEAWFGFVRGGFPPFNLGACAGELGSGLTARLVTLPDDVLQWKRGSTAKGSKKTPTKLFPRAGFCKVLAPAISQQTGSSARPCCQAGKHHHTFQCRTGLWMPPALTC